MQLEDALVRRYGLKCARVAQVNPGQDPSTIVPDMPRPCLPKSRRPTRSSPSPTDGPSPPRSAKSPSRTGRNPMWRRWWAPSPQQSDDGFARHLPHARRTPRRHRHHTPRTDDPLLRPYRRGHAPGATNRHRAGARRRRRRGPEGVGATEGDRLSPVFDAYVTPHMVKEIRAQGAVATVCGHFIDAQEGPYVRSCPTASFRWSSIA